MSEDRESLNKLPRELWRASRTAPPDKRGDQGVIVELGEPQLAWETPTSPITTNLRAFDFKAEQPDLGSGEGGRLRVGLGLVERRHRRECPARREQAVGLVGAA